MPPSRDDYSSDVTYEVWRSGGDVDRIDRDRVDDHWREGDNSWAAAEDEVRRQREEYERYLRDCDPLDEGR